MIAAIRERIERGDPIDVEREVAAHPHLARRLRPALALLARLDRVGSRSAPSLVGERLGAWRVLARLGGGGMGEVFLAEGDDGGRVAVKVIHPHLLQRPGFLDRFRQEAALGRRIRHENVVAALDAFDTDAAGAPRHCLVMEHVEGQTLRAMLDDLGRVPEDLCRHIGGEIAKGLAAIHAAGVVHRDVKPDNVIVTREHVVKLMDLGVARLIDEAARLSQTGAFVGSLRYAAPEQLAPASPRTAGASAGSTDIDGRGDLHALGLTLYELATGVHPFDADDVGATVRKVLDAVPRPAGELNPQLSPFFEDLLARLLEKDREKRPESAAVVARILDDGEEGSWWRERATAIRTATRRPLRRIRIPRETALYGRDEQLALLRSLYDRATTGDGQVVLIEGEAGIGKSRLVDEFVGQLAQVGEDVNFLYGSYPPGGVATASGAFSVAYREHLGDDESAIRAALPVTPLLVPAFAALLRGDIAPEGAEPLTKDSLQTVFVHATRSFAATRPTVVLIDDLHFAPAEGRALFASLALAAPGHRILLVGCARPSLDEKWGAQIASHPHTTRLALTRLGAKELVRLLRDALSSERLAEELSALIALKSDGNPFFVFELLRGLRDGQFLRQRPDGTWESTQVIRDIQVPSSIAELVQARVTDLEADDKNLLDVAACCGFEFDPLVVAAALGIAPITALQHLARIEKRHRLVRSSGRRFVFDHHQVQEALYAGMPELLRESYHAAIAEAIETRTGAATREPKDVDGAVCVDLARHFLDGAKGERALRYLHEALASLRHHHHHDAAIRLATNALEPPGLVAGSERSRLLGRLSVSLYISGAPDRERAVLEEALAAADASGDTNERASSRIQWGVHLVRTGRTVEADDVLRLAVDLAREAGDVRAEGRARGNLGETLVALGRFADAEAEFRRHVELAVEAGDREGAANSSVGIGMVQWHLGKVEEARETYLRCLTESRALAHRSNEVHVLGNLAACSRRLGSIDDSRRYAEQQLALARDIGFRRGEALAAALLCALHRDVGRTAEALVWGERAIELARETRFRMLEAGVHDDLTQAWIYLGLAERTRRHFEESLTISRAIGARDIEGVCLLREGMAARELSDLQHADARISEAVAVLRSAGFHAEVAAAVAALGGVASELGQTGRAIALLDDARRSAQETQDFASLVVAAAERAALPSGDVAHAAELASRHASRLDVTTRMRVEFLLWRTTSVADHLRAAKELLDLAVAGAPQECREPMLTNVALHRDIDAAARRVLADTPPRPA